MVAGACPGSIAVRDTLGFPRIPTRRPSISPTALNLLLAGLITLAVASNNAGALAQPALAATFGVGPAEVGWIVFGYTTAFAVATAVWGGLARRFGVGPAIAAGVTLMSAGSLAAGFAPSLDLIIAARVVQGLGTGAIPTLATAMVARRFDGPARSRALGLNIAAVATGLAIGPLVGGLALDLLGPRGPLAFGVVAAPSAWLLARIDTERDAAARIDLAGAVLVVVAVVAAVFSLNRIPILGLAGPTLLSLGLLAVSLPLLAGRSKRPLAFVPRRIVAARAFLRLAPVSAIGMTAFLGSIVLVPTAGALAYGLEGIALGALLLPMALVTTVVSLQNARIQDRIGRRGSSVASLASLAFGAILLGLFGVTTSPAVMALLLVPIGAGFGLLNPPLLNELTTTFEGADRPVAVGMYNLVFFLGGAVSAAVATGLVQAGLEIGPFLGRPVPGYSTVELLLAAGPLVAAAAILRSRRAMARARITPTR
jgi:DHA2 family metal-tetracycline-proton antiporter-like MFS transporter